MSLVFATSETAEKRLIFQSINIVMDNKSTQNMQENVVKHYLKEFSLFHAILHQYFSIKSISLHWMKGTLFWTVPIFEHCISR